MTTTDHAPDGDLVSFDLHTTPFSSRGSWMNLSPVIGVHEVSDFVHVVSHKTRINPVLKLVPAVDLNEWLPTESRLTLKAEGASIEIAFQSPHQIRVRCRGVALTLESVLPRSGRLFSTDAYRDQVDDSVVFTVEETGQRYRVKALGDSRLTPARLYEAAYRWDAATPAVTLEAADVAELVIEELEGASLPDSQYPPFDEVVDARRDDFVGYLDVIAPFRSDQTPGVAHAAYVNWATTVFPSGFLRRNTVLMSKHWMDKAWSWDHCFNALASSRHSADAWDQYWVMFDHQSEAGQLPDSIAHSEVRFNYSKPPIHGLTLGSLLARTPEEPAMADLARLYDTMEAWTHWWRTVMTAPGESLAHYYFGNDSGWDNSTMFDGFHPIQAPDLNAFLVLQMEVLADLATRLGRGDAAARWTNRAERTLEALVDQLWDGERFVARHPKTGETRWSQTLLLTMPIILGRRLHPEITEALTRAIASHLTDHGLATEHPESPDYDPDGYWRGPIWAPSTYLIWQGLRESGQEQLAAEVSERFRAMCERSGFAENFDAVTGAGLRDRAYTWTASVYLLLSEEAEKRG